MWPYKYLPINQGKTAMRVVLSILSDRPDSHYNNNGITIYYIA